MKTLHSILLFILFTAALQSGGGMPSTPAADCRAMLRACYGGMDSTALQCGLFIRYRVDVMGRREHNTQSRSMEWELTAAGDRMQLLSEDVRVYYDELHALTLMPQEKRIVLADAVRGNRAQAGIAAALRDSMLQHGRIVECGAIDLPGGGSGRRIVLHLPPERTPAHFPVRAYTFEIDQHTRTLHSFTVHYREFYPLRSMRYEIQELLLDYVPARNLAPVYSQFFSRRGTLRSQYKNFRLNDVRNHANKGG